MSFKIVLALSVAVAIYPAASFATVKQMECREWIDKKYKGKYLFKVDTETKTLSISYENKSEYTMFGDNVEKWTALYQSEDGLWFVFAGVDAPDSFGPAKVLSLDFSGVMMFDYSLGPGEEFEDISEVEQDCARFD